MLPYTFSSYQSSYHVEKHSYVMMLLPPCFTVGMLCLFLEDERLRIGPMRPKNVLPVDLGDSHMPLLWFGVSCCCAAVCRVSSISAAEAFNTFRVITCVLVTSLTSTFAVTQLLRMTYSMFILFVNDGCNWTCSLEFILYLVT